MYDDAQIQARTVNLSMNPSPEIEAELGSSRDIAESSEQDTPQNLKKLRQTMQKFRTGSDTSDRRDLFLQYLQKEIGSLRYGMAQDALNNIQIEPNIDRMMGMQEANTGEHEESKGNKGNGYDESLQDKPRYPCPLLCNHKVAYGSACYCPNFRNDTKSTRIDKVKRCNICKKCLKKGTLHAFEKGRAPNCQICKGAHHTLICTEERGQQRMFIKKAYRRKK